MWRCLRCHGFRPHRISGCLEQQTWLDQAQEHWCWLHVFQTVSASQRETCDFHWQVYSFFAEMTGWSWWCLRFLEWNFEISRSAAWICSWHRGPAGLFWGSRPWTRRIEKVHEMWSSTEATEVGKSFVAVGFSFVFGDSHWLRNVLSPKQDSLR